MLGLLLVGAGVAFGLLWKRPPPDTPPNKAAPRPVPVVALPVRKADLPVYLHGLGTVVPLQTALVKSRVDGELIRVAFTEGQLVKAGDLLAEIDPRPYRVLLDQAQGQYARDQALLKNARLDLERYRTLLAQDSIAGQQLDTQQALAAQYEATLKVDQSQIDSARLQLTYARITAPISGRLGLRLVDRGNIVHANDAGGLVVITQIQPVAVVFSIPEDSLPRVQALLRRGDDKPAVEAYDREGRTKLATGALLTLDNQIDSTTGTVKLKAQFDNADGALFANQFVNARLLMELRSAATLVPSSAIQRTSQGALVYVVKADKTVSARPVVLGPTLGEDTSVESGVAPGESVVADGGDRLREGSKVEPISRDPAAGRTRDGQRPKRP